MSQQAQRFIEQAMYALQQGEPQQALGFADQACAVAPYNADAQLVRGIALSQLGHASAATEALHRAIQLSPHDAKAYYNLALHYYNLGYRSEAAQMANEALRVERGHLAATQLLQMLSRPPEAAPPRRPAAPEGPAEIPEPQPSAEPIPEATDRATPDAPYGTEPLPPGAQIPPAGSPYGQPPGYGYVPPPQPSGLPFVRSLGSAWDAAGYLLIITGMILFFIGFSEAWKVFQQAIESGSGEIARQPFMPGKQLLFFGARLLSILWLILDIADKRTSPLWLIPMIICCCCGADWFILAAYLAVGRKL